MSMLLLWRCELSGELAITPSAELWGNNRFIFSFTLRFLFHILSKMAPRAPFVVPALKKHTSTVIMAHGLGDRYLRRSSREMIVLTDCV
jgi:hypothetical protein